MHSLNKMLAIAALAAAIAAPAAQAAPAGEEGRFSDSFTMMKPDKDGMVSKHEVMKMVEKMFDKQDTKKMGKLDKKQFEQFLVDLMRDGA